MSIDYHCFPELTLSQRNQLFSIYSNDECSFLLDSGQSTHKNYDIIAVKPLHIIKNKKINDHDPIKVLKSYHKPLNKNDIPEELRNLPCLGGIFFALSYDLGRAYEKIDNFAIDDLNLANIYAGVFGCIVVIDHCSHRTFLICSNAKSKSIFDQLNDEINHLLESDVTKNTDTFSLESDWTSNFTQQEYANAFNQVQSYIQAGDCYQVNLAQRFSVQCSGESWQAYCLLTEENQAPFSAFVKTHEADIISLSPERFIQLNGNKVQTQPIKGTRPRGDTLEKDTQLQHELINSSKDQAENLMIVDLMRNDLGKSCKPGSIKVPKLFNLETFRSVHHLVSTIEGELEDDKDAFTLLASCFPGGSITGAPKIRAMNIIDQLEPHRRSYYCGSIGYIDIRGNMDCSISIRTLVRKNNYLYCWAGGGLVSDSVLEDEYQETFDKVSRILPILK